MKKSTISLVVLWLATTPMASAAEIYKWIDEHGEVHYADRPRNDDAVRLQIKTPAGKASVPGDARRALRQRRLLEAFEHRRQEKKQRAEQAAQARAKRRAECQRAGKYQAFLERTNALYSKDANGERRYLSEQQRESHFQENRKRVAELCD